MLFSGELAWQQCDGMRGASAWVYFYASNVINIHPGATRSSGVYPTNTGSSFRARSRAGCL
jgi:hypothetical protein